MFKAILAAGAVVATGPLMAAERGPKVLEPASQWLIDYGDEKCRAARLFGDDDDRTILMLDQYDPGGSFIWTIAGGAIPKRSTVSVQFGPIYQKASIQRNGLSFGDYGPALLGMGLNGPRQLFGSVDRLKKSDVDDDGDEVKETRKVSDGLDLLEARELSWVAIEPGTPRETRLDLHEMEALYKAMNACMQNLAKTWGFDPAMAGGIATKPKVLNLPVVAKKMRQSFPLSAAGAKVGGILRLRLIIEADGNPSKCEAAWITLVRYMDDRACIEFTRSAKFAPALDANGKPVRSLYATTITYSPN